MHDRTTAPDGFRHHNAGGNMATFRVDYVLSIEVEAEDEDSAEEQADEWLGTADPQDVIGQITDIPLSVEEV